LVEFNFNCIEELFPSPLWVYDITDRQICSNLKNIALSLQSTDNGYYYGGNWWSNDNIQYHPDMKLFCEEILNKTEIIFSELGLIRDSHYISNMWFTISKPKNQHHTRHIHPNCLLSGIFYVNSPKGCAVTTFYNPNPAQEVLRPNYTSPHRYTDKSRWIDSQQGRMVIFPSWLPHSVEEGLEQEDPNDERIALAFNIMMRGEINSNTSYLKLS